MKAISLHQPWASLIADGIKTIETRRWRTNYRDDLLICSTKQPSSPILLCGYALAIVTVTDCVPYKKEHADAAMVRLQMANQLSIWSWMLEDIRRIKEPFKVVGRQGFFNVGLPGIVYFEDVTKLQK